MTDTTSTPQPLDLDGRVIGPKEQHALDTAPFDGLAQHYYVLFLRGGDAADRLSAEVETLRTELTAARADAAREKARADRLIDLLKKRERQW